MQTNQHHGTNPLMPSSLPASGNAAFSAVLQALIVGLWVTVPFAIALAAPQDDMNAYFLAAIAALGVLCFAVYAISFGLTEALLVGLIFITNSAFVDHAYLPRVPLLGGNLYLSDYYLVLASGSILMFGKRREGRLLGTYHKYFLILASAIALSVLLGLI